MVWLRMIIPVSVTSHLSMIPSIELLDKKYLYEHTFKINTGIYFFDYGINEALADTYFEGISVPMGALSTFFKIFTIVWIVGMAVFFVLSAVNYIKLRKTLSTSVILKENVWQSDQISTPFVLGFLKPKIYIPFNVDQDELDYIISHEKSHIKHFDNLTKTVAYIILIINWYNPLMWVAYKQFSNDLELYCDETVVKNMKKEERNKYIKTLLNNTVVTNDVFVETLFFGELDIKKERKIY